MFNLYGKSILITGATGNLGRELANGLAALGGEIHVNSRTESECKKLVDKIERNGFKARVACFDVTSEKDVQKYVDSIELLDVLVNNSYAGVGGNILSSNSEDYISSYQSSVVACANLIKQLEHKFNLAVNRNGYASIINIASMYGMVSPDQSIYGSINATNPPFYGAAKAALIQFSKYAACEFAKKNIRVNSISPGPFPSHSSQRDLPEMVSRVVSKVPMGRIGIASEIVGPVAFLASEASSYVTGINIPVDGGWTAW